MTEHQPTSGSVPPAVTPSVRPERSVRPWLVAIFACLAVIAAALVALDGIVWVRTAPTPVPTGPDRKVSIEVRAVDLVAEVLLVDSTGSASARLPDNDGGKQVSWHRTLAYGEKVDVRVAASSELASDDDFPAPTLTCTIQDENGTVLTQNSGAGERGSAECIWTNT